MKRIALMLIKAYQKTLSPDHGLLKNYLTFYKCRFYPTCSEYCRQAIDKHGLFKGLIIGLKRIGRCHPWGGSGLDPLK